MSIKVTPRSTTCRSSARASLSSLGGPHAPCPVMRIAPKPICPTGNWAGMLWADTFDLLLREFVTGHLPAVGIPDRPAPAGLRWRAAFAPWSGSRLSQLAKGLALDIPDLSARTGWSDEGYAPSSGSGKLVMNAFYEHHNDSIRFGYRCFDRILLNGLIQPFQQPERVVGFFNNYRQLYPVGRDVLRARGTVSDLGQGAGRPMGCSDC